MKIDIELIEMCERLRKEIRVAEDIIENAYKPTLSDRSLLKRIHELLEDKVSNAPRGYGRRAEIFVILYLYAPDKILGKPHGKETNKDGIFLEIAKVLNLPKCSLSVYRSDLMFYYKTYKEFRDIVSDYLSHIESSIKK